MIYHGPKFMVEMAIYLGAAAGYRSAAVVTNMAKRNGHRWVIPHLFKNLGKH